MRKHCVILPFLLFLYSCSALKNNTNDQKKYVVYESFGESHDNEYTIDNRFFYKIVDSTKYKTAIHRDDWNLVKKEINKINIDSLSKFKAPSDYREVDGAWYTQISIGVNDTIYNSPYYDDGNPNEKLKSLDKLLHMIIKKYGEKVSN